MGAAGGTTILGIITPVPGDYAVSHSDFSKLPCENLITNGRLRILQHAGAVRYSRPLINLGLWVIYL